MHDNRTMAQLLEAPTEGYEDAIVVPEITADNFELKHGDKYGYIKNHKKTVKNGQARARESEENKKKPKNQSRGQKVKNLSQSQPRKIKVSQRWSN
ncbi:hypothetical protein Tco_0176564 [Tanacetum coccineum]